MKDLVLLNLLESVLGKSKPTSKGNYSFKCPKCIKQDDKYKLEICVDTESINKKGKPAYGNYACWRCSSTDDEMKGENIYTLFKKLNIPKSKFEELSFIYKSTKVNPNYNYEAPKQIKLPDEFISLNNKNLSLNGKHALNYLLKKRNLTLLDIQKYNIGYCEEGMYSNRIIIPSYDYKGNINYFSSRTFIPDEPKKYNNPPFSRDMIPFELYINWDLPLIICEGVFDAIALKRNTIPLFGTIITRKLMEKLVSNKVTNIYFILDNDAFKKSLKYSEYLIKEGKKIYFINLSNDEDPSKIGFVNMLDILYKSKPLNLKDLMKLKFKL